MPKRLPRTAKPILDAEESRETLCAVIRFPHDRDFVWVRAMRLTDKTRIDVFVHTWTERRLLLGDDGAIFGLTATGRYKQMDFEDGLWRMIPHRWEWLEMGGYVSRDVGPEPWPQDEDTADRDAALESAWSQGGYDDGDPLGDSVSDADLAF